MYNRLQMTLLELQKHIIDLATTQLGRDVDSSGVILGFSNDPAFGDVTTNVAMVLATQAGVAPRELAQKLADDLPNQIKGVERAEAAGPGFLNIWLRTSAIVDLADAARKPEVQIYANQTVLMEYSDPNPFKPLHAGHLYTTLVGDTLSRLVERGGAG